MQMLNVTTAEFPPLGRAGFRWRLSEAPNGDPLVSIQHNALIVWRPGWTGIVGGVAAAMGAGAVTADQVHDAIGEAAKQVHARWSEELAEADLAAGARRMADQRTSICVGGPDDGIMATVDRRRGERLRARGAIAAVGLALLATDKLEDAALAVASRLGRGRIAAHEGIKTLSLRRPQ